MDTYVRDFDVFPIPPPYIPFEVLGIDNLWPFFLTDRGNRHVVVAVGYPTKWVEARPFLSLAACNVVGFLRSQVFLGHGVPKTIITDWGTQFSLREFSS